MKVEVKLIMHTVDMPYQHAETYLLGTKIEKYSYEIKVKPQNKLRTKHVF
jgi:FAD synthase